MEKLLYPVNEAADMLGLGRVKLYELLMAGEIASVTVGRRRLIPVDALRAFVAKVQAEQAIEV